MFLKTYVDIVCVSDVLFKACSDLIHILNALIIICELNKKKHNSPRIIIPFFNYESFKHKHLPLNANET